MILILTIILLFLFSSCSYLGGNRVENRAIVQSVAIDLTEQGKYQLTIHLNESEVGIETPPEMAAITPNVLQIENNNLYNLFEEAKSIKGKEIFFGHLRFFVLSKEMVEKRGISEFVEIIRDKIYFIPNSLIFVAKNLSASDIIIENAGESILPTCQVESYANYLIDTKEIREFRVFDMLRDYYNNSEFKIPLIFDASQIENFEEIIKVPDDGNAEDEFGISEGDSKSQIEDKDIEETNLKITGYAIIENGFFVRLTEFKKEE